MRNAIGDAPPSQLHSAAAGTVKQKCRPGDCTVDALLTDAADPYLSSGKAPKPGLKQDGRAAR